MVDQILEVAKFNPMVAHGSLATGALKDFEKLPQGQKALMAREIKRLLSDAAPPETPELVKKMLETFTK